MDPRVEHAWLDASAAAPGEAPPTPDFARLGTFVIDRAYHGADSDGAPWVRGGTYRARFGAEGATYTPFLGSDAPRTWPVEFSLARVEIDGEPLAYDRSAPALRDGDEINYQRGTLTERYEVGVDSIEQIFVFDELPARGEIVLRIAVETDLVACETPDAIEFANERGKVRYGRATAFDASGASVAAETTLIGDVIEIRVPADFVAAASLPLVIDPLVTTWFVASTGEMNGPADTFIPTPDEYDCAYDATYGRWLIVWRDSFASPSGGLYWDTAWRLIGTLNGQTIASGMMTSSSDNAPRCANNNATNQFLVAYHADFRTVKVQTISAANGQLGAPVVITESGLSSVVDICIGGDPYPTVPSYFAVGWRRFGMGAGTVQYRMLAGNTPVSPVITLSTDADSAEYHALALSRSNGGSYWNIAWAAGDSATNDRVLGARITWSGTATPVSTLQSVTGTTIKGLAVSPSLDDVNRWALAYVRGNGIYGDDVHVGLVNGTTLLDDENLSLLTELSGVGTRQGHQQLPSLDSDGRSFSITYADWFPGGPGNDNNGSGVARIATVAPVGNQLLLSEAQVLDYGQGYPPRLASTRGSGLPWRLQLAVYKSFNTGYPILGALYDNALFTSFCHPGYDSIPTCPCGNAPIQYGRGCNNSSNTGGSKLYGSGISSVGSDSMSLTALNLPTSQTVFFYQGTAPLSTAVFSGRGVSCVGGSQILLYTKPSTPLGTQAAATAPYAGEVRIAARSAQLGAPILAGQTRYYYAAYRPVGTSGGGNGAAACTTWFSSNVTQSLQALWVP